MIKPLFHARFKLADGEFDSGVRHYLLSAVSSKAAIRQLQHMAKRNGLQPREYQIICQQIYGSPYLVAETDFDKENIFG